MSTYLYGDLHRDNDLFPLIEQTRKKKITDEDILIILGDFGGIWFNDYKDEEWIENLENTLPYKYILFVDGNHECFEKINKLPIVEMFGNPVHKCGEKTYHLMRGFRYNINEKTFFVMGGASSVDKFVRVEGISWWPEEMPSEEEYERAFRTLDDNEYKFDYILSHCAANSIQKGLSKFFINKDKLTCFFESILDDLQYKHWYFGHYHMNKTINKYNATCIYRKVIKLK